MIIQEELVQSTVLDNIITACTKTLPYAVGFTVEGLLKISLTTSHVITVDVNESGKGDSKDKRRLKKRSDTDQNESTISPPPQKRKRGRPRKADYPEMSPDAEDGLDECGEEDQRALVLPEVDDGVPAIKQEMLDAVAREVTESAADSEANPGMQALQSLALQLSGDSKGEPIDPTSTLSSDLDTAETSGEANVSQSVVMCEKFIKIKEPTTKEEAKDENMKRMKAKRQGRPKKVQVQASGTGMATRRSCRKKWTSIKCNDQLNTTESGTFNSKRRAGIEESILVPELQQQKLQAKRAIKCKGRTNRFMCHICAKDFYKFTQLESHVNTHLGLRPYQCHFCEKSFAVDYVRWKHEEVHRGNVAMTRCRHCEQEFPAAARYAMALHERRHHTGEKPHQCSHCGRGFHLKATCVAHEAGHAEVKPYMCATCGKSLASESSLAAHERRHGEPVFQCGQCERKFHSRAEVDSHARTHTGEKPHQCAICGEKFASRQGLATHELRHTGKRAFQCTTCNKAFVTKPELKSHEFLHSGARPYQCPHCPKNFRTKPVLRTHLRTHTGEKPYECSHCDKRCTTLDGKKAHERTHTGERPYSCEFCQATFKTKVQIKRHRYTIHAVGEFKKHYYNHPERFMKDPSDVVEGNVMLNQANGSEEASDLAMLKLVDTTALETESTTTSDLGILPLDIQGNATVELDGIRYNIILQNNAPESSLM